MFIFLVICFALKNNISLKKLKIGKENKGCFLTVHTACGNTTENTMIARVLFIGSYENAVFYKMKY